MDRTRVVQDFLRVGAVLWAGAFATSCVTERIHPTTEYESGRRGALDHILGWNKPPQDIPRSQNAVITEDLGDLSHYSWPLSRVEINSPFGPRRGGDFHEGLDLKAAEGTSVFAVEDGLVLYSDRRIRGYGRMIVVKHGKGYSTVYAHNSELLVRRGQRVKRGQRIARSGQTGHATGPHLHFELRRGTKPLDPLAFLPPIHSNRGLASTATRRKHRLD